MSIPVFKPTIRRKDMDAVLSCLAEEQIGPGGLAEELVRLAAAYLGISGGFAVREYARALDLALSALEVPAGGAAVLSPLAPAVIADVLRSRGIEPLYADASPDYPTLRADSVAHLLERKPSVVIVDEALGYLPDMDALAALGIPLIEDVSMSIGAHRNGRKAGTFGRFVLVSLEPENIITSGGGTLVLSQTPRDLGLLRKAAGYLDESAVLANVNAALAISQLRCIEEFVGRRKHIAEAYHRSIQSGRHRTIIQEGEGENVFHSFPVVLEGATKEVMRYARSKGIQTREAFAGSILRRADFADGVCPNARSLALRCVLFPLYPMLSKGHVEQVARVLSSLP